MPRPATGTVEWRDGKNGEAGGWWARVTCPDGSRPWIRLTRPYPNTPQGQARAREAAHGLSERIRERGLVAVPQVRPGARAARLRSGAQGETLEAWSKRWIAYRKERGYSSVPEDEGRLRVHVHPEHGVNVMAAIGSAELVELVAQLDAKVRAGDLNWKTARNVWANVTRMFKDACRSKVPSLRVRENNPSLGVEGPDRGGEKAKAFLYPSEVSKFLASEAPLQWRRLVVLAVYLGVRASELEALEWEDFDLEHGRVTVHRAMARGKGTTKGTKSDAPRPFNVERELLPLLRAMRKEAGGKGRVIELPANGGHLAEGLRALLKEAKVERPELYVSDATRLNLRFHDLRATHITWAAVRGDNPALIMARVGHEDFATMQRYLRQAEVLQVGFGEVFGSLPEALLGPKEPPRGRGFVSGFRPGRSKYPKPLWTQQDLNL
jgi:integrase